MPIRLRDANAFVARLRATTADATASIAGTHAQPPNVTGSIVTRLGDAVCAIAASFTPVATRTGVIATTLQHAVAAEFGTAAPPPVPNRSGSITAALAGVSSAMVGSRTVPGTGPPFWPNWPIMNTTCLQGSSVPTILDPAVHSVLADKDVVIFQSFYPTTARLQSRIQNLQAIKAINPRTRFFMYEIMNECMKVVGAPQNNAQEITKALIESPTEGNERWYVHRVGQPGVSGRVEAWFDPPNLLNCNMAILVAGLNSLGENYAQAYWRKLSSMLVNGSLDIRPLIDGVFLDVAQKRAPLMFTNNGATSVTDQDYNNNGVADGRADYSAGANAGGRFWAEGHLEVKARFETRFPGKYIIPNAASWDFDYLDGGGAPPLPLTNDPFYRRWELPLDEVSNFNLGLRFNGTTAYQFTGGGSASGWYRGYYIMEKFLKPDADVPAIGKCAVLMQGNGLDRDPPQASDIEFVRFTSLLPLFVERAAPCIQLGGSHAFSLDELLVELGNPVGARVMGTLNENTLAWALRAANFSSGNARFYWTIFEKGMVLARLDSPSVGVWPSADAAVPCPLPTAPAGKKWQRLNAATYVNPVTGRATRNQTPSINSGADVTSVSLRPYHAVLIRLVNA
jgi:hypothetical protein